MKSFDSNNDFNINIIRLKERLFIIYVKIAIDREIYLDMVDALIKLEINSIFDRFYKWFCDGFKKSIVLKIYFEGYLSLKENILQERQG
ncbi:hypothetical protein [uncultured Ilyobacter sp.]|uniref:hypothetical protein n=1 Tax=uncultured Ilyobacter sp. TaxID=544433 RepID=UPI0029F4EB9F|nr:hypothetical protein [uncultured Ilyobacter sp.]